MAGAFLPDEESRYNLERRIYPAPFPLTTVWFNENEKKWDKENLRHLNMPEVRFEYFDFNTVVVDGRKFQFLKMGTKKPADPCSNEITGVVSSFVLDSTMDLHLGAVKNYSSLILEKTEMIGFRKEEAANNSSDNIDFYKAMPYATDIARSYKLKINYLKKVHQIVDAKSEKQVAKVLSDFLVVLNRYNIEYHLNAKEVAAYFKSKDFIDINGIVHRYEHFDTFLNALEVKVYFKI